MNIFLPRLFAVGFLALASIAAPAIAQQQPNVTAAPILPDPKLTPGDVLDVSLSDIQEHGYSAKVRNVPVSVKREVYASYGISHWEPGQYEVDHLISLSLGGSNSKKNLWPESRLTQPWNANVKDQLEAKLLALVRGGKVDLHTAQQEMAKDWIAAYKKYVSPEPLADKRRAGKPARSTGLAVGDESARRDEDPDTDSAPARATGSAASTTQTQGGPTPTEGQVWVNTKSGVIWKPGSAYYGKTKAGRYMSETEALAAGYHDAK